MIDNDYLAFEGIISEWTADERFLGGLVSLSFYSFMQIHSVSSVNWQQKIQGNRLATNGLGDKNHKKVFWVSLCPSVNWNTFAFN